jgi:hypothetical protein
MIRACRHDSHNPTSIDISADSLSMDPIRGENVQCIRDERRMRLAIITALYRQRQSSPGHPGITLADMEQQLGIPKAQLEFSLWYLTEGQFVKRGDNGNHSILLKGVDLAEELLDHVAL